MALRSQEDLLRDLIDLLDIASDCDQEFRRTRVLASGMRRLANQAHYYPLRRLADQWQRLLDCLEEAC